MIEISIEECMDNIDYFAEINIMNDIDHCFPGLLDTTTQPKSAAEINTCSYKCCNNRMYTRDLCRKHFVQHFPEFKCSYGSCINVIVLSTFKDKKLCIKHKAQECAIRKHEECLRAIRDRTHKTANHSQSH